MLARFVAHLLIRLLVVTSLPVQWQVGAALLPLSLLWGVVRPAGRPAADPPQTPQEQGPSASSERSPNPASVQVTRVKETFTLASGEVASEEERSQDILLFRKPAGEGVALAATIPITPSRTFSPGELMEGKVHLDILAGREAVRGKTGGSDAVTLESGDARLSVAAGALLENTAIAFEQAGTLSSFLPSSADLLPLAELVVDFSGKTLSRSAELSVLATGVSAEDTLLVAEVVRAGDVPHLAVVALAQLVGDRVVSVAYPGLPGIVEGGRYVFYRSIPVGFVSGVTSSPAGPVKSLVATDSLAFVSYSKLDGTYIVAARPGSVGFSARVTGTSLLGAGTTTVIAAQTSPLNISLAGVVTAAVVTPADGSLAVPTSVQVEITTPSPMNPATVSVESIKLFRAPVSEGQAVSVRFVLSASTKTLAVIPQAALEYSTSYTLVASGLADAFGGLVQVPRVTFTTKDSTVPTYDTRALKFSFPDASGIVQVTAPAGSLPAGTTILIIDSANGVVLSLTAGNDGSVSGEMPATINDVMIVTITDPLGNVTTFNRSQFEDPVTGKTAVGAGGGTVEGQGGIELRIPEGALQGAARFKITPFRLEDLPEDQRQTPDFPQATLGGGLKVESEDKPELKKEAKLAFPLPSGLPANPKDAFFYVYRKLQGPDGKVYFQTIDQAFVECPQGKPTCPPEQMRVVTASFPFLGVVDFAEVAASYFLMSTYDQTQPGKALSGTITGRVLRQKWENTAEYEPLRRVTVLGVAPDSTMAALTDDTGRFTLFDPRYTGGTVEVRATVDGVTKTATAYEANPNDWTSTLLRFHPNVATADIVFPAVPPAGPPASIQIVVVKEADRAPIAGFAQVGTPLLIGFKTETTTTISGGAVIQGAMLPVQGPLTADPSGFNYAGSFTPSQAGTHTVTVTGVAASGQAVTASSSFLAVAAGGSNNEPLPNEAPRVLTDLTLPQSGAKDVPVTVFPQVVFSEPVRGLKTGVTLTSLDGSGNPVKAAPVSLLGITPAGQAVEITDDSATVTSLTVRPTAGLAYATPYKLSLKATITDLDAPPKPLETYEASFTTFGPKSVGGSKDQPLSPGIALLGDHAYLVENLFYGGTLKAYDVSNPVEVTEIESARKPIVNHPMDVTGELDGPLARRIVAVATASTNKARPSNLHLFDTSDDGASQWIGAVSLTPSAVAGSVRRIAVKGSFAYAITFRKGIQAVDLQLARSLFVPCGTGSTCSLAHWDMLEALSKDGQGFGGAAVVRTTPVRNPQMARDAYLWDLEVRDFVTDPSAGPKPLVVATGDVPLVVADAQLGQVLSQGGIEKTDASGKTSKLSYGHALGLGYAGLRTLGVVGGLGTVAGVSAKTMVAVVGLDDPRRPQALGFLDLSDQTCLAQTAGAMLADVLVKDDRALIGGESCVAVVNLTDPTKPILAGTITSVGGRLALGEGNVLFSTERSVFAGSTDLGGVRTAALGLIGAIPPPRPTVSRPVAVASGTVQEEETTREIPIRLNIYPRDTEVKTARLEVANDGLLALAADVGMSAGQGTYTVPKGFRRRIDGVTTAEMRFFQPGGIEVKSARRKVDIGRILLRVDSNNDTIVAPENTSADDKDEQAAREGKAFSFWTSQIGRMSIPGDLEKWKDALLDFATLSVRLQAPLAADEKIGLRMSNSGWQIARKVTPSELGRTIPLNPAPPTDCVADRKLHHCHEATATYQAQTVLSSLPGGFPGNALPAEVERAPSYRGAGVIELNPLSLILRENDFLFSCDAACADKIEVGRILPDGSFEPLGDTKVDFQPLRNRFSVFSVREGGADGGRPLANAVPFGESDEVPPDTDRLLVLTHGFVVPTPGAVEHFFPQYVRRLYWAGVPVLEGQRDAQGRKPYTVGFTWPSQLGPSFTGSFFFPEAEYAALQSGVPFARLLENWKSGPNGPRQIDVLAHSLGNIVTNSAIMQMPAGVLDRFVMHEPALAAEAFDYNYQYTQEDKDDHWATAIRLGYSGDGRWSAEWQDILDGKEVVSAVSLNPIPVRLSEERWCSALDNTMQAPRPFYFYRWSQRRPDDPRVSQPVGSAMQCGGAALLPQRGPWLGMFASNRQKTRIVNTFSAGDRIVGAVWTASQNIQKPNRDLGTGGQAEDERIAQFWARLRVDDMQAEQYLWPDGGHSDLVRQWQELAYWFPALSRAAGRQALPSLENRDLTPLVKDLPPSLDRTTTHSFATEYPLAQVWGVHRVFADVLK